MSDILESFQQVAGDTATKDQPVALTALDRCDTCSAAALHTATKDSAASDLLFCGHHARKHASALVEQGWTLHGDSEALSLAEARRE